MKCPESRVPNAKDHPSSIYCACSHVRFAKLLRRHLTRHSGVLNLGGSRELNLRCRIFSAIHRSSKRQVSHNVTEAFEQRQGIVIIRDMLKDVVLPGDF